MCGGQKLLDTHAPRTSTGRILYFLQYITAADRKMTESMGFPFVEIHKFILISMIIISNNQYIYMRRLLVVYNL